MVSPDTLTVALMDGDLTSLSAEQRRDYYQHTCDSLGLNSLTQPFGYIVLNGKLRLYALKGCTDQLRQLHKISIEILNMKIDHELFLVHVRAKDVTGRVDEDVGFAVVGNLKGENLGNAQLKAITKAKRRVTLSICGLGMLDETEVSTINGARTVAPDAAHDAGMSNPLPVGEGGTAGAAIMPVTNGHRPAPEPDEALVHPTEGHLAALRNLAVTECMDPVEVYEDRIRTTMKIPKQASVSPRLLTKTMTMAAYMDLFAYYRRLEAQLAKGQETTSGTDASPEPDAGAATVDPAYHQLYQEAFGWGVTEAEIQHTLEHHPLDKARTILWRGRNDRVA